MKQFFITLQITIVVLAGFVNEPVVVGQVQGTSNTMTAGENSSPPNATLEDVRWITGQWQGEAMGGTFEETWTAPNGDSMMGMFRHVVDDKANFYELLTIVPDGESLVLRLKHFSAELHGWEDKDQTVDFPLVKLAENEAYFDGLTFRRVGPDQLHIFVVIESEDGKKTEMKFAAQRAKTSAIK